MRRLWSYKISKDKYKRLYLFSKHLSVEDIEALKASHASLEERLAERETRLKDLEAEKNQLEAEKRELEKERSSLAEETLKLSEEKEKLSSSLQSAKQIIANVNSTKDRYEEMLVKKDEQMEALKTSINTEKQKSLDAGMHLEEEKWKKFILPEKKLKHEKEAICRFLDSPLFEYLATTKLYPQFQEIFDKAIAQAEYLGALRKEVDLSQMAVYLGKNLDPVAEDGTSADFSNDEFSFALEVVQDQVIEEIKRKAAEEARENEGQVGVTPVPRAEERDSEVPLRVNLVSPGSARASSSRGRRRENRAG